MKTIQQPHVFIKTALINNQLKAATQLNPHMEIQLLGDFLTKERSLDEYLDMVKTLQPNIHILHSPLAHGEDTDLAQIEDPATFQAIDRTCQLAQMLADYYGHRMPVVLHFGGDLDEIKAQSSRRSAFISAFVRIYEAYPMVDFYIENVTTLIFSKHPSRRARRYRDADPLTAPGVVNWLRDFFKDNTRFYTVLDTCHALMTVRLIQTLGMPISLEEFFEANAGVCGLIHLANARNYGIGVDHGTPFLKEDEALLRQILEFYQTYEFNCPLTLEINETDYQTYQNYQATVETLKPLLAEYFG